MIDNMTPDRDSRTIVVSDLHVSSGALDDFDSELESCFTSFLKQLASGAPVELVINGDFLDFVQAPPWKGRELESRSTSGISLCFTEDQSKRKLQAIYSAHGTMFNAIGQFLASDRRNRLVILPGNHDADFFWPSIRADCSEIIKDGARCSEEQIHFHLESSFRPKNNSGIWIEHGHQFDSVNCFKFDGAEYWSSSSPPILTDTAGTPRLCECTGTRFMIKYLNGLDESYPFVDNVKPFSRFLQLFGASAFVRGLGPIKAAVAVWAMLRYLSDIVANHPSDLLGVAESGMSDVSLRLRESITKLSPLEQERLGSALVGAGFPLDGRSPIIILSSKHSGDLIAFLAEHPHLLDVLDDSATGLLGMGGRPGTLTMKNGFVANESQNLTEAAEEITSKRKVNTVVMGHTHEPVLPQPPASYFNTGSWTRYYRYSATEKTHPWDKLRANSVANFPYQLIFVEVRPRDYARSIIFRESGNRG
jgi:UDP-2,3-diacylglucosamine pyrophosphatase LpxH